MEESIRGVTAWANKHDGECSIRNSEQATWREQISSVVRSLEAKEAKRAGFMLAVTALASLVGAGGAQAFFKLIGW